MGDAAQAVADARDVILALAPGFLALKVLQLFGAQRKRSEWEWTAWSVLVAALISVLPIVYWAQLTIGLGLGVALAIGWRTLPRWPLVGSWATQNLQNSTWDLVLDRAVRDKRVVEVALGDGATEQRFFGRVGYFAYEQYEGEPWIYLTDPQRKVGAKPYSRLKRTTGVMVHKDSIKWVRVVEWNAEKKDSEASVSG